MKELQGRVDEVKKNTTGDIDGAQGAGHAEGMDMDDVSFRCPPPLVDFLDSENFTWIPSTITYWFLGGVRQISALLVWFPL